MWQVNTLAHYLTCSKDSINSKQLNVRFRLFYKTSIIFATKRNPLEILLLSHF